MRSLLFALALLLPSAAHAEILQYGPPGAGGAAPTGAAGGGLSGTYPNPNVVYGTTGTTAAAGNDSRITGAAQKGSGNTFTGNNVFSGPFSVTGTSSVLGSDAGTTQELLQIRTGAGQAGSLEYRKAGVVNWQLQANSAAQTGFNNGDQLMANAYDDAGVFTGSLFQGERASGPLGNGKPYFSDLKPFTMSIPRTIGSGGVYGEDHEFGVNADTQPVTTLPTDPLTTSSGTPTVTVHWVSCCNTVGASPVSTSPDTWVNLLGVAAVGGITPTGWLKVASIVDNDNFTVTWTSNATSSATGGGASVTVQPSFGTIEERHYAVATTGASNASVLHNRIYAINPMFLPNFPATGPLYEEFFDMFVGPPDGTQTKSYAAIYQENDFVNRGSDEGYNSDLSSVARPTIGTWTGAWSFVPPFAPGGGTPHNWNTIFGIFQASVFGGNWVGVYDVLNVQKNALVGAAMDPTGHGGVAIDVYGSYSNLPINPFATASGTATITVTVNTGSDAALLPQNNGDTVYIPTSYTISGTTFGAGLYTMANVNHTTHTFTITGTGNAGSSISGGGSGQAIYFTKLVPYSPEQFRGEYLHGIITTQFKADSGGLIETQPGNGFLWNDGTGTASITGTEISAGNVHVDIAPVGTGKFRVGSSFTVDSSGNLVANTITATNGGIISSQVTTGVADGSTTTTATINKVATATLLDLSIIGNGGAGGTGFSSGAAGSASGGGGGGGGAYEHFVMRWADIAGSPSSCSVSIPPAHLGGAVGAGSNVTVTCGSTVFQVGSGGDGAIGANAAIAAGGGGGSVTSGAVGTTAGGASGTGGESAGGTATGTVIASRGNNGTGGGGSTAAGVIQAGGASTGGASGGGSGAGCNAGTAAGNGASSGLTFVNQSGHGVAGKPNAGGPGSGGGGGDSSATNSAATAGGAGGIPGGGGGGGGDLCNAATGTPGAGGVGGPGRVIANQS